MILGRRHSRPERSRQVPSQPSNDNRTVNHSRLNQSLTESQRRPIQYVLQRIGGLILLVALIISAANILSLSPYAHVESTPSNKTFLRPLSTYTGAADSYLNKSVWNKNKITIDSNGLADYLKKQFPELSTVNLEVPLTSHTPLIYVAAYQPALILRSASGQYAVNSRGVALLRDDNSLPPNLADLPVVTEDNSQPIRLNQPAIASSSVSFIDNVATQLKAKGYLIASLSLPAAASELDVQLANQPYVAKFNLESNDPTGEAGTLLATLKYLKQHNITPSQYIDIRLSGRAYYK